MVKIHTTLSVDADILQRAKQRHFNMSEISENALREKLGEININIQESEICEFCKAEGIKETAETANSSPTGLSWLYPDERWICNSCLTRKGKII